MKIFDAIVQGLVQGLTEFLPVSSSGHLAIAQHFLGIRENNLLFDVSLHLGTLISVLCVYHKLILKLVSSFFLLPAKIIKGKRISRDEKMVLMLIISLIPLLFLFVPIPKIGNLKTLASNFAESADITIVGISLLATSALLTIGTLYSKFLLSRKRYLIKNFYDISGLNAFFIGIAQLVAGVFPGLSRSGSTLSVGLLQGIKREAALDFSFLMGTPAIVAASLLEFKEAKDLGIKIELVPTLIGIFVSAVVGCLSIKLFKWLISGDRTWIFAVYSLIVGILILVSENVVGI